MLNHWWTIWSLPVYPTCYIWTSTSIIDYWKQADLEQVKQSLADFLTCFKKKRLHNRINDLEILGILSSAVSSSIHLLLFFYLSTSISEPCTNHKKWDPPQSNFNPRSISNQQHYIGNHQNLLEEKKANFHGLYISVRDPLIDWCVNMGLKQQQQQQHGEARRGEARWRQTVFVYEDQVFSAADGSQRGSISHQAERSELSCPDEGVQLYIIISRYITHFCFPIVYKCLIKGEIWHFGRCCCLTDEKMHISFISVSSAEMALKKKMWSMQLICLHLSQYLHSCDC